jgi:prepilin-type N-terminal cleavage/methylation domain-containing protein
MNRIFQKIKIINKREHGFTFIELLIAIAISLAVGSGIAMFSVQVANGSNTAQNRLIATKQVEYAVDIISRDAAMVQSPYPKKAWDATGFSNTPGSLDESVSALYLGWLDWDMNKYLVTFWIENGQLKRHSYKVDNIGQVTQSESIIARNVVWRPGNVKYTRYSFPSGILTFTITCDVNGARFEDDPSKDTMRSRTFQIVPR